MADPYQVACSLVGAAGDVQEAYGLTGEIPDPEFRNLVRDELVSMGAEP